MPGLLSDFRYGLRALASRPSFTIAAVLTLALGIGANTAVFSVINGLLLKPLPYADGERLVQVYNAYPTSGLDYAGTSIPDYLDRKSQVPALEDLALYSGINFNTSDDGQPQRLVGIRATSSLFTTLGASAAMGRVFGSESDVLGQDKVAVLSHSTWNALFAADPSIVGRDVRLNGEQYRVVGVMPQGFAFPNTDVQLWVPFAFTEAQRSDDERGNEYSEAIGRLTPGTSVAQLNDQLHANVMQLADRVAGMDDERAAGYAAFIRGGGFTARAKSLRDQWVGELKPVLFLLQAVVGLVLLIACANVANLMLTRVHARQRELSVRTAMGAGRWRIVRQLLAEALVLALAGGILGVAIAHLALGLLDVFQLAGSRLDDQIGIDNQVLFFTFAISAGTGVLFGLLPAMSAFGNRVYEVLKEGGRAIGGGRAARLTRSVLVVAQMALAVSLLVGAGLLIRSFWSAQAQDPGFKRDGLVTARLDLPRNTYSEDPQRRAFYDRLLGELAAVPGITQSAFVSNLPFGQRNWTSSFRIEGKEVPEGQASPHGYSRVVDDNFFAAMEIPVLQGRTFQPSDSDQSGLVMVVDEVLARKHFPDGDAVGQTIVWGGGADEDRKWTIIGVVGTVKISNMTDEVSKESYYTSYRQLPTPGGFLVARSNLPTGGLISGIRQAVLKADPELPIFDIKTLDERIALSMDGRRAPMLLVMVFAGVALLLSAIGIYGVLSYAVQQRTGEIGVRMAIGAQRVDVQRLVLGQGSRIVAAGLLLGLAGAFALAHFMQSQLYGISSSDPLTMLAVVGLLGTVAMFACYLPARRAARTNPMVALREE